MVYRLIWRMGRVNSFFLRKTGYGVARRTYSDGRVTYQWQKVLSLYEPIHEWFELTYAQYLTIPRSVLQSMPKEWQRRFVVCLNELDEEIDWRPERPYQYRVTLCPVIEEFDEEEERFVEAWGAEIDDPLMDYERGRRRIPLRERGDVQI